ncbi:hypothetical protein ACWCYL_04935 [Streptomyces sp. 900105755]
MGERVAAAGSPGWFVPAAGSRAKTALQVTGDVSAARGGRTSRCPRLSAPTSRYGPGSARLATGENLDGSDRAR